MLALLFGFLFFQEVITTAIYLIFRDIWQEDELTEPALSFATYDELRKHVSFKEIGTRYSIRRDHKRKRWIAIPLK